MYCKARYTINLKPDPTIIDTGDLILLLNLENRPFQLEYYTYIVINRITFCESYYSAEPYYLVHAMLSYLNNAPTTDGF